MSKKLTVSDRIYQAQATSRLSMLRRMRRELGDDITRLDDVLQDLRKKHVHLAAEIQHEQSQWNDEK